jgi:hypothetical protein
VSALEHEDKAAMARGGGRRPSNYAPAAVQATTSLSLLNFFWF